MCRLHVGLQIDLKNPRLGLPAHGLMGRLRVRPAGSRQLGHGQLGRQAGSSAAAHLQLPRLLHFDVHTQRQVARVGVCASEGGRLSGLTCMRRECETMCAHLPNARRGVHASCEPSGEFRSLSPAATTTPGSCQRANVCRHA